MKLLLNKSIYFILFSCVLCYSSFAQFSLKFTLRNSEFKQAYFCSLYGQKVNVIAAKKFTDNIIEFKYTAKLPKGIYRIVMSDSAYVDLIVDRDANIILDTKYPNMADSMKVLSGEDNKIYYRYMQYKNKEINLLNKVVSLIKPENQKKSNLQTDERVSFVKGCITYELQLYAENIINKDTNLFISKVIKATLLPNMNVYLLKHPDSKLYGNDVEYLFTHFFDNIDFADTTFLRTEFYYRTIKYYIEKIALPRNVLGFNLANEFIIGKAKANDKVYDYCINLLIELYENTQLEEVFVKLYDEYLSKKPSIVTQERYTFLTNKVNIIKNMKQGSVIPDISGKDTTGKEWKLSESKSNISLLFIWASDAKHSEESIKQLLDIYKKYKDKGFEIFSVSLDTTETPWKNVLRKLKPEWINCINTTGRNGEISKTFNTWSMPSYYLIDKKRILLAKPMNVDYLKKQLETIYK